MLERILCGNSVDPGDGRMLPEPLRISICLRAISSDFFDIVLPKPVLSEDVADFVAFFIIESAAGGVF